MNKDIKKTYVAPKIESFGVQMDTTTTIGASGTAYLGNFGYGGELGEAPTSGGPSPGNYNNGGTIPGVRP